MKKILSIIGIALCIVIQGYTGDIYTREGCIVEHDNVSCTYTVEDTAGNMWQFHGGVYMVGDKVSLTMRSHHTSSIHDDTIARVKIERER